MNRSDVAAVVAATEVTVLYASPVSSAATKYSTYAVETVRPDTDVVVDEVVATVTLPLAAGVTAPYGAPAMTWPTVGAAEPVGTAR